MRQARSELAEPYEMHRTLMRAFPQVQNESEMNAREMFAVLFRVDWENQTNRALVFVQSAVEPDWSFLAARREYLLSEIQEPNPAFKDVSVFYQSLHDGQVLYFRLRANPTKRIQKAKVGDVELEGKRVGLLREEEQVDWLMRKGREREKGTPGGFELLVHQVEGESGEVSVVPRVSITREGKISARRKDGVQKTTHLAVRFDGLLRIIDADVFRETLARGIGPGKAFGFGLLSIVPIGELDGA
jgi:CRISPR system Cascade subunit CasE